MEFEDYKDGKIYLHVQKMSKSYFKRLVQFLESQLHRENSFPFLQNISSDM